MRSSSSPLFPFDRMIVAQARAGRIPVLSADPWLARYDVEVIAG